MTAEVTLSEDDAIGVFRCLLCDVGMGCGKCSSILMVPDVRWLVVDEPLVVWDHLDGGRWLPVDPVEIISEFSDRYGEIGEILHGFVGIGTALRVMSPRYPNRRLPGETDWLYQEPNRTVWRDSCYTHDITDEFGGQDIDPGMFAHPILTVEPAA